MKKWRSRNDNLSDGGRVDPARGSKSLPSSLTSVIGIRRYLSLQVDSGI
jgi:hypothetical protein